MNRLALALAWVLQAQSFDVVSVKPSARAVGKDYNNQVTISAAGFSGRNVTLADLNTFLDAHKPGDHLKLKVETRGATKDVDLELAGPPGIELEPYEMAGKELTPEMKSFRDAWLSSKAVHQAAAPMKYCSVCKRALPFEYTNCPFDGTALSFIPGGPPEATPGGRGGGRGARGGRGGR